MIFSELYSAYYNTVAEILKAATDHSLRKNEMEDIIQSHAFGESLLRIEPALMNEEWQLLRQDGTTPLCHAPSMPLTVTQKRWLKAISLDPRIRLFQDEIYNYPDVEPLFTPDDYTVFDRYQDGDDYEDENYRRNFRRVLDAVRNHYPIKIEMQSRWGKELRLILLPNYMEYSEKDDKFRVIGIGKKYGNTVNIGRIMKCKRYNGKFSSEQTDGYVPELRSVVFELNDQRNALERALLHFAHFKKEAERLEEDRYRVTVWYDKEIETEIVIRILSFGPLIRVVEPSDFVELIRDRLIRQKKIAN